MEIGCVSKRPFWREKTLNPSKFLILLKMVWHMRKDDGDKDDGDKDCQCSLPSNI